MNGDLEGVGKVSERFWGVGDLSSRSANERSELAQVLLRVNSISRGLVRSSSPPGRHAKTVGAGAHARYLTCDERRFDTRAFVRRGG